LKHVLLAIMFLINSHGRKDNNAGRYADLIVFESKWYDIDPYLISSLIDVESGWNESKISKTHDFGLMQVHTAKNGSSRFWGKEVQLLDPRTNIREGIRILAMWRNYHVKYCNNKTHHFLSHYKWGKIIRSTDHAEKVLKLYDEVKAKFDIKEGVI
jgi:hypothetical protein